MTQVGTWTLRRITYALCVKLGHFDFTTVIKSLFSWPQFEVSQQWFMIGSNWSIIKNKIKLYLLFGRKECRPIHCLLGIPLALLTLEYNYHWNDSIDLYPSVWKMQCSGHHKHNQNDKRSRTCQKWAGNPPNVRARTGRVSDLSRQLQIPRLFLTSGHQYWWKQT